MINIQYIKNGSKRIRHVLKDNCMLKSLHRFPTSTSPETSGLLMEKCKLWIEPPSIPFRDRIWGVSFFFYTHAFFFINCKRDRFLRIVLYSGKLHLLIFEKFPFEKMIVIMQHVNIHPKTKLWKFVWSVDIKLLS